MRLGHFVCAALALGLFASPIGAQPALPDQLAQASTPPPQEAPPPFPPMPRAKPSHRWTSTPPHRATPEHRTTRSHRAEESSKHHAKASSKHQARHHLTRAEKDLRYCHQLTTRHQMRNARCKALLRDEKRAAERRKQRESAHASRVCHRLTKRALKHNHRCQALLRDEKRAAEHRKAHRSHRHRR